MKENYNEIVYQTSINEIEKLNNLTEIDLLTLKTSQLKNNHVLAIIKQQELDYKNKDLELRTTMYHIRNERNNIMRENNEIQKNKLEK